MTPTLDLAATSRVPFTRLVRIELRKARDTRAGFWLLAAVAGIVLVVLTIALIITLVQLEPILFGDFISIAAYMMSWLLPFLAIMLVTSEWSQRSALVTFTLEPRRSRVVWAKLVASMLITVVNLVLAFAMGLICTVICEVVQPDKTSWDISAGDQAGFFVTASLAMLGGFAIATLLLNTPASIVLFVVYRFVLPGVLAALAALSDTLGDVVPWIDFQGAQGDIYEWELSGTEEWSHLIVSGVLWLALPMAVGLWRVLRAEVK